ncbi:hypothetical protein MRX96_058070 [Rhipicephalus microplus]
MELPWRPDGCPGLLFISFVPLRPSTNHQLRWQWPRDCGRSDKRPATRADVQPNLQSKQQKPSGACPAFEQHSTVILAPHHVDIKALLAALSPYRLAVVQDLSTAYARLSRLAQDRIFFVASCYSLSSSIHYVGLLYGDSRRRCNKPVKELPVFAAAFSCKLPFPHI